MLILLVLHLWLSFELNAKFKQVYCECAQRSIHQIYTPATAITIQSIKKKANDIAKQCTISDRHHERIITSNYNRKLLTKQSVSKIIDFIIKHSYDEHFCAQVRYIQILQKIIHIIVKKVYLKHSLQNPIIINKIFNLLYNLIARHNQFIKIIEVQFNCFLYLIYSFPKNHNIVERFSQFLTSFYLKNQQSLMKQYNNLTTNFLVKYQQVIKVLLCNYIFQNGYEIDGGEWSRWVEKGQKIWFKNAIKSLEICYSLIVIHTQRNLIWQIQQVKESIFQGFRTFLNSDLFMQKFQQETTTDSDSMNEYLPQDLNQSLYEQNNLYFISLLLDISMIKQQLLQEFQISILQQILCKLLIQLNKYQIINLTAIKIIKILYEQVILNEEDLNQLAQKYSSLKELIASIIDNDYI